MADINVERKSPKIWPWIVGLLVLALVIWAVAEMVTTDDTMVADRETIDQPAAFPAPAPAPVEQDGMDLSQLTPLGPEDAGQRVTFQGEVTGQTTGEGFWVRTVDGDVVFVRTTQMAQTGQQVRVTGTVATAAPDQAERWRTDGQLTEQERVHQNVVIDASRVEPADGAMQQRPGAPGTQPGTQPPPGS
jgi:hypothetical protein